MRRLELQRPVVGVGGTQGRLPLLRRRVVVVTVERGQRLLPQRLVGVVGGMLVQRRQLRLKLRVVVVAERVALRRRLVALQSAISVGRVPNVVR